MKSKLKQDSVNKEDLLTSAEYRCDKDNRQSLISVMRRFLQAHRI